MRLLFIVLLFLCSNALAQNIKIVDGDTIHINKIKYRFHGIDAPEMSQKCLDGDKQINCGVLSKQKLEEKIGKQNVTCKKVTVDRYKRMVAECFVNNESLSKYLVRSGYAFAYRKYSTQFVVDEDYARTNKLGLWKTKFEFPWNYRRKK